jgi:serine/threonine protein kinase
MEPLTEADPASIGGYELRARLGTGGFGQVFLGLSPGGRAVAVKVLQGEMAGNQDFLHRFRLEVVAAQRVNGIYTAPVVAAGLDDRPPWVATGFVPGPTLARMISEHGPLPELAVWRLLAGLVEALQAIHACGLVHRDLKPANVMLRTDGSVCLIDFGLAKANEMEVSLTGTREIFGTPYYMSPEQGHAEEIDGRSDLYSLGVMFYEMLTGRKPYTGATAMEVIYKHKRADLPEIAPQFAVYKDLLMRLLAKSPADRFQSAGELLEAVSALKTPA